MDDTELLDAVLSALERPSLLPVEEPLHGDALRACAHWILASMSAVTAAGFARAGEPETEFLVVWVADADRAVTVEDALTRIFPELARVVVTGRQRLTDRFEHHELRLSPEARLVLPNTSREALAPMLARALGAERLFESRAHFFSLRRAALESMPASSEPPSEGARCAACDCPFELPWGTNLEQTRCPICGTKGLVGTTRKSFVDPIHHRVRCPSCDSPFSTPEGALHARCPACGCAVRPIVESE